MSQNKIRILEQTQEFDVANGNLSLTANLILTGNLEVSGNIDGNSIGGGNYQVDVYANGNLLVSNADINFNNTSTVNVAVVANGNTQANIAFSVNTSALPNGGGTVANATTTTRGITLLIDSVSSNDTGNAATANSVEWSYNLASNANTLAQSAVVLAANAWNYANAVNANSATYANGNLIVSTANINFNNTSTVNVAVVANGNAQANIAFSVNTSALPNGGGGNYQVDVYANGNLVLSNSTVNFNNTSLINAVITANGTVQTNISYNLNASADYSFNNVTLSGIFTSNYIGSGNNQIVLNSPNSSWGLIGTDANANAISSWSIGYTPNVANSAQTVQVLNWSSSNNLNIISNTSIAGVLDITDTSGTSMLLHVGSFMCYSGLTGAIFISTGGGASHSDFFGMSNSNGSIIINSPSNIRGVIGGNVANTWTLGWNATNLPYAGGNVAQTYIALSWDTSNTVHIVNYVSFYTNTGSVISNTTLDVTLGDFFDITLGGNYNLTFNNAPASAQTKTFQLLIRQSANGSNTISYANTIKWPNNTQPLLTTIANNADLFQFTTFNNGVIWIGHQLAANLTGMNSNTTFG